MVDNHSISLLVHAFTIAEFIYWSNRCFVRRYLDFFHAMPVRIFNAAEYRRQKYGNINDSEWFDGSNVAAQKIRHEVNLWAVNGSKDFLSEHKSGVAIIDSTNPTHKRRALIVRELLQVGAKVMFIEVINDNQHILTEQYRETVESSPDFEGMEQLQAEVEYRKRIDRYHLYFEPIDEGEYSIVENYWSYMKCDHNRKRFIVNRFGGHLPQRVVHFIMNLRTSTHPFYLSRHGQSIYNALGKIGGDSGLSEHGLNYAKALAEFVDRKITRNSTEEEELPARLWTSTLRRTHETTQFIRQYPLVVKDKGGNAFEWRQMRLRKWHHLDELFAGECDGLTYEEIEKLFPEEFERRSSDKLAYRYPRGESYLDVIARLEPVIIEMERHAEPLLIVAHQGILRIIVAFYTGLSRAEAPYVSVPLNTVLELVPSAFGCKETRHVLYKPEKALPKDGQDEPMAKFPHLLDTNPSSH
jgi:broad specificity phosphatase PhoE